MTTTPHADAPEIGPVTYRLTHDSTSHESGSLTDLVGKLVPGYTSMPAGSEGDDAALLARWEHAVAVANLVQQVVLGASVKIGEFDVNIATEDTLTVLFADRINPVGAGEWTEKVPLVLIASSYAPFTDREPPTGNVRWINPHNERTFLESLAAVGVIEFEAVEADEFGDVPDEF